MTDEQDEGTDGLLSDKPSEVPGTAAWEAPSGAPSDASRGSRGKGRPPRMPSGPQVQLGFLLMVVIGISLLFLAMIGNFILTLILAGIFAGMARPTHLWLEDKLGQKPRMAAMFTVFALLLLILIPLAGFLALVLSQAVDVSDQAGPWISEQLSRSPELFAWLQALPLVGPMVPEQSELVGRASELVTRAGSFVINNLGAATTGTVAVFLQLFVMLYAIYYFLIDGKAILGRILYYTPLKEEDEEKLVEQFVSVTRATIKGSILVGLIQGGLAGSAFFLLGLPGAAFWSTVMAVLSIIPVLGSGIVWAPASVILVLTGRAGAGLFLAIWGLVVVGLVDNVLRPRFVGRDTKMHDLLVLLSTFGGLAMFGVVGFMIGPVVGALFLTAWKLYGTAFQGMLPSAPDWAEEVVEEA
ncbi:MAG: AI-2E family transporter [Gemmatimonadetes bacterium]|nr:AI-2E family transporter [Gemmatimonadota bacterium]NNF13422.1 AI-2E family transporter [Gemmatimonadota bacterium]